LPRALFFSVLFDDIDNTGVDAGDQAQYAEPDDNQVLQQAPVQPAKTRIVPARHQIDTARQDQA